MDCPSIPLASFNEFSIRLGEKALKQRIPLSGSLEVTARCNLRCVHCYINLPANDATARRQELSEREIKNVIDQVADLGCLNLLLTGGEPFLRPDFLDVYAYAKRSGLLLTIFTNGTLITPKIADYLAKWRPSSVEITLYGRQQKTYEKVTGIPGSYGRCMRGIELLLERELPLKLKTMAMTVNKDEILEMQSFAESLGVDFRFDPAINLRVGGGTQPADYRISPEAVVSLDLSSNKRIEEWQDFIGKFSGAAANSQYLYHCGAGLSTFHIDPYGELSVCMTARKPGYNLRQGSFIKGWQEFFPKVIEQKWTKKNPCKTCEILFLCGQCPGWSQLEYGDQQTRVEYLCKIAHLRARALGINGNDNYVFQEPEDFINENNENQAAVIN